MQLTEGARLDPVEYRRLRGAVGWSDPGVDDDILGAALDSTWNVTARDDAGELLGMARLMDDGALYATVCDMVVDPSHQHSGIGRAIFERILARAGGRSLVGLRGQRVSHDRDQGSRQPRAHAVERQGCGRSCGAH